MAPLIGVTTGFRTVSSGEGSTRAHSLYTDYTAMVQRSGGLPVALVPLEDPTHLAGRMDGLVLTGGGDVDPARYGGAHHEKVYGIEHDRDEFEIALVRLALEMRLPTLAICRGQQILNVALGGTLIEDIATSVEAPLTHLREGDDARSPVHDLTLVEGSRLATTLGVTELRVNSVHHQAIREPGQGLTVTAWSSDGVVEGLEHADETWPMWSVQWHPEWLPEAPSSRALFGALVDAARSAAVAR